jgi:hypothetical protein
VKPAQTNSEAAIVGTWTSDGDGGPMLWIDHLEHHHRLTLNRGLDNYLDAGRTPAVNVWQLIAATYDGTTARYYINGVEVASKPFSGNVGDSDSWRIGAYGTTPGGFFHGLIDDVRIYDDALPSVQLATQAVAAPTGPTT